MEPKKLVNVFESSYNTMTLIAKKNGFSYPDGHPHQGKMDSAQVVEYLIKNFQEPIA